MIPYGLFLFWRNMFDVTFSQNTQERFKKLCVIPVRCVKIGSLYDGFIRCSVHFQYLSFLVEKKPCFLDDPFLFTDISLKWTSAVYYISSFLKRSITSDLRMKNLRIWIVSIECHKICLPNEVTFSGLPLIVGENFCLMKSMIIEKY